MSTLKDIAEHVGVSISTVSRVVNNDTSRAVHPDTRQKIWEAVAKLGYQSNKGTREMIVRGKQKKLNKKVGCIVAVPQNKYNHPYFSSILEGIERGLEDHGFDLAYIHSGEELKKPNMLHKIVKESEISGIILVEGIEAASYEYIKAHVPYVVGIDIPDKEVPRVGYDRLSAAKHAVAHLIERGHKRIGYIGGSGLSLNMEKEKRFRGYQEMMREAGLPIPKEWVLDTQWDVEKSYELMKQSLEQHKEVPTAMFAASDMMAISAMRAALELNYRIPQDIAFASIDNIEFSQYCSPPLTTVDMPKFEIGWIAAKTLIDYIDEKMPVPVTITLPFKLIERGSS
ncbi:LacI family DNA-binding transcriptional regulator [Paenibacillus alba]|uniref:LacI family DNA-binding transcriptional regulator n=1 Tax=Paenibacillus alba TaxID=1197127 RepID=A0ABU6G7B6_9BACL|nr:LacI family DNA-binding transcriptional regulator [Paenibacillus alba]MEC0229529.1 LacI family DNA-binding transcriptional regulator [Paenibacillus alba]